jgi:L-2-hydroxyglutarate oxidase
MVDDYDITVIGAGLVGLATARELLLRSPGLRLAVLEKESEVARHQSGRNSGVVHTGLYYAAGSLKAQLCREGRERLLGFADEHGIPYRLSGKLVIAVDETELPRLAELRRRGTVNGLRGLRELSGHELRHIEPRVAGVRALHVPETGVIDFRLVARALVAEVRRLSGSILFDSEATKIERRGSLRRITMRSGGAFQTRKIVACAGLQADRIAALTAMRSRDYRIAPFRGDFFVLSPEASPLVRGLIYPVPDPAFPFLGVHFTRRIDGAVWAGPTAVPALAREGYSRIKINLRDTKELAAYPGFWRLGRRYFRTGALEIWRDVSKRAAVRQMRRYLPDLEPRHVTFGPCGIRAQILARDGTLVDDFLLERDGDVLHVLNAPSPAATASLAIGARLAEELEQPARAGRG